MNPCRRCSSLTSQSLFLSFNSSTHQVCKQCFDEAKEWFNTKPKFKEPSAETDTEGSLAIKVTNRLFKTCGWIDLKERMTSFEKSLTTFDNALTKSHNRLDAEVDRITALEEHAGHEQGHILRLTKLATTLEDRVASLSRDLKQPFAIELIDRIKSLEGTNSARVILDEVVENSFKQQTKDIESAHERIDQLSRTVSAHRSTVLQNQSDFNVERTISMQLSQRVAELERRLDAQRSVTTHEVVINTTEHQEWIKRAQELLDRHLPKQSDDLSSRQPNPLDEI